MARNPTWLGGKPETKKPTENSRLWKLVAWGGIEPPTQGFSTLIDHVLPVHFQALAAWLKVGVRIFALHNTQG
jgi:hypothetical protein